MNEPDDRTLPEPRIERADPSGARFEQPTFEAFDWDNLDTLVAETRELPSFEGGESGEAPARPSPLLRDAWVMDMIRPTERFRVTEPDVAATPPLLPREEEPGPFMTLAQYLQEASKPDLGGGIVVLGGGGGGGGFDPFDPMLLMMTD